MESNTTLAARVSKMEKVEAGIRSQLANERRARHSVEDQIKASLATQTHLEDTCDKAASEICMLRTEVENIRTLMHKEAEGYDDQQVWLSSFSVASYHTSQCCVAVFECLAENEPYQE